MPVELAMQLKIHALNAAVAELEALNAKETSAVTEKIDKEVDICIASRALYARFIDSALWGEFNALATQEVGGALQRAFLAVSLDEKCKESVTRRWTDFKQFAEKAGAENISRTDRTNLLAQHIMG